MTAAEIIATLNAAAGRGESTIVLRHRKSGKQYFACDVRTQPTCSGTITGQFASNPEAQGFTPIPQPSAEPGLDERYGLSAIWFTGNPVTDPAVQVVGERNGKAFGPIRFIAASQLVQG